MEAHHDLYVINGDKRLGLTYLFNADINSINIDNGLSLMCVYGKKTNIYWLNKYLEVNDIKSLNN